MGIDIENLNEKFGRMGARVKSAHRPIESSISVNIARDRKGEYFDLSVGARMEVSTLDVRKNERHLVLCARQTDENGLGVKNTSQRFLCGHDERAWFVAAVPEHRAASNVREAMEALKPMEAVRSQERERVRFKERNRRRNAGFVRQGEWFFVPAEHLFVSRNENILRNEQMRRGGGKPHYAEFAVRTGGEVVYVNRRDRSQILTQSEHERVLPTQKTQASDWLQMRRNAEMYVRGRITHRDHKTIVLPCWHLVVMNNEHQSIAMRSVAFLD